MSELAQLLFPAIRWDSTRGYEAERDTISDALDRGVGGFILFGGPSEHVAALTEELHSRSRIALLIGADMERGAGQQFAGETALPPIAAIASLGDVQTIRRAASLTAAEAKTLGLNWIFAPVCDLDEEPENPIVGTRSFGGDPEFVGEYAAAWIDACQAEGVLACAKHFPGHGRTTADSHQELPVVNAAADLLRETDIVPFRRSVAVGVASIMTAHVAFPPLDASASPATLSKEILTGILRAELGFNGLIVSDALTMAGVLGGGEADAVVRAVAAGCDCLLCPSNVAAAESAISRAIDEGRLNAQVVQSALERRTRWARWAALSKDSHRSAGDESGWSTQLAERVVHMSRGTLPSLMEPLHVVIVDDDVGGRHSPPSREPFISALRDGGAAVVVNDEVAPEGIGTTVVAVFGDIRAGKGRPGLAEEAKQAVQRAIEAARDECVILHFSHPRLAKDVPEDTPVVCAWGGEPVMQRAAARVLLHEIREESAKRGVRTAG